MVVPYRAVADYTELSEEETAELAKFTKLALKALRRSSNPDAVNVASTLARLLVGVYRPTFTSTSCLGGRGC